MSHTDLDAGPDADNHLDAALASLLRSTPPTDGTVTRVRAALLDDTANLQPFARMQRRRRRVVGAILVAAVTAVGLVAPSVLSDSGALQDTAAARSLTEAAAAAIRNADPVVGPGQYLYIKQTGRGLTSADGQFIWSEAFVSVWIPADRETDWLYRSGGVQTDEPIAGVVPTQPVGGPPLGTVQRDPDITTPCGLRYGFSVCTSVGSFQTPTLAWIDALPDDPDAMYDLLTRESVGRGKSDEQEMLVNVEDALHSGLIPAGKRAAMYLALARVPGLTISDSAATLDGRTGTAFTVAADGVRLEVIIDPVTGRYIGNREVLVEADAAANLPAGLVSESSAVRTAVVDRLGEEPR